MPADNIPPPGGAPPVRRRAFLAGTLGSVGAALAAGAAAGCAGAVRSGARKTPLPSPSLSLGSPTSTTKRKARGHRIAHRPNDGSGLWADFSNTGYRHDPGYTGSGGNCTHGYAGLDDYAPGMIANSALYVDAPVGHVFNQIHFRGTALLGHSTGDNWIFNGCVFDNGGGGQGEADFILQSYLPTACTWNYCTFKPCDFTMPPGNDGTVSTSHSYPGTPWLSSYQSFNTNSEGSQTGIAVVHRHHCDIWGNAGMQDVFDGTASNHVILDWCYIHDQADTNWSTAIAARVPSSDLYHHDGIGPDANSGSRWINITNCTVASLGTTNAIAFQGTPCRDHLITGNYFAGFGNTINLGGSGEPTDTNITFTDNVLSAEVPFIYRPLYIGADWDSAGRGMVWRRNRFQFFHGDPTMTGTMDGGPAATPNQMNPSWQGQYWWPSDSGQAPHQSDYTG
jgi:hypothetical protein